MLFQIYLLGVFFNLGFAVARLVGGDISGDGLGFVAFLVALVSLSWVSLTIPVVYLLKEE